MLQLEHEIHVAKYVFLYISLSCLILPLSPPRSPSLRGNLVVILRLMRLKNDIIRR